MQVDPGNEFVRRWWVLAADLGIPLPEAEQVCSYLRSQYSSAERHYHDMRHIVCMLKDYERFKDSLRSPEAISLAIFFHDVIYKPARGDNEELSARVMVEKLKGHVEHGVLSRAQFAIQATKQHLRTEDRDTNILLDLDMSILGQEWTVYERYAIDVRREFLPVCGESLYREGRVKLFLEPTIAAGEIYITEGFKSLNGPAIRNMQSEMKILESGASFGVADSDHGS